MIHNMSFQFLHHYDIQSKDTDNGRFYTLPDGKVVPSVTTVIGNSSDKTWLKEWKERVGEKEAERLKRQAAIRGTAFHSIMEAFLNKDPDWDKKRMPINMYLFNNVKPLLIKNISCIYGIEIPLFSYELNTAGRCDLIAEWNNKLSVVDFKTANRIKEDDEILDYFIQATCYAMMANELYKLDIQDITIVLSSLYEAQVITKKVEDYIDITKKVFQC